MEDRIIGRKPIIQFLNSIIGCESWNAVRNQIKNNGMPVGRTPNGKPYVVPKKVREWDARKRREAENN